MPTKQDVPNLCQRRPIVVHPQLGPGCLGAWQECTGTMKWHWQWCRGLRGLNTLGKRDLGGRLCSVTGVDQVLKYFIEIC
jgi:hypothetical protein